MSGGVGGGQPGSPAAPYPDCQACPGSGVKSLTSDGRSHDLPVVQGARLGQPRRDVPGPTRAAGSSTRVHVVGRGGLPMSRPTLSHLHPLVVSFSPSRD